MNRVSTQLLHKLSEFNAAHPWSHNEAYTPWILGHARAVRRGGGVRALDVGCGAGHLIKKLAVVMPEVMGLEPDEPTATRARHAVAKNANTIVREAPFDPTTLDESSFDLVTLVAVLHQLPLTQTLEAARDLIRPGGRLVIVGLAREVAGDRPRSLISMLLNPMVGLVLHPRRALAVPEGMTAPTAEPMQTFDHIAAIARRTLPGVRLRRSLFWRYTAVWISSSGA